MKKILRENRIEDLRDFIEVNRSKIELEYEMDGTIGTITDEFPDIDEATIDRVLNKTLGI